jgi:hypothetical protein
MTVYPLKKMKICRWDLRRPQVGVGGLKRTEMEESRKCLKVVFSCFVNLLPVPSIIVGLGEATLSPYCDVSKLLTNVWLCCLRK